jgi:hypothetical protein
MFNSRRIRWTVHVEHGEKKRNVRVYRILMGKPEEKRPLGRPRRRRENNIKWILEI